MTGHLFLSRNFFFLAKDTREFFMLVHKILSMSVIYWGIYLIHEVVGKTLSTTPSGFIE